GGGLAGAVTGPHLDRGETEVEGVLLLGRRGHEAHGRYAPLAAGHWGQVALNAQDSQAFAESRASQFSEVIPATMRSISARSSSRADMSRRRTDGVLGLVAGYQSWASTTSSPASRRAIA